MRDTTWHNLARSDGEEEDRLKRTYLLPAELIARLDAAAANARVGTSDLVQFLLDYALDVLDAGRLHIPTKEPRLLRIDHNNRRPG